MQNTPQNNYAFILIPVHLAYYSPICTFFPTRPLQLYLCFFKLFCYTQIWMYPTFTRLPLWLACSNWGLNLPPHHLLAVWQVASALSLPFYLQCQELAFMVMPLGSCSPTQQICLPPTEKSRAGCAQLLQKSSKSSLLWHFKCQLSRTISNNYIKDKVFQTVEVMWACLWAAWSNWRCPSSLQGSWTRWTLKVPSNLDCLMVLWFQMTHLFSISSAPGALQRLWLPLVTPTFLTNAVALNSQRKLLSPSNKHNIKIRILVCNFESCFTDTRVYTHLTAKYQKVLKEQETGLDGRNTPCITSLPLLCP